MSDYRKRPYDDDGQKSFNKRDRRNEKVIKVLCPYYSAGAVIGKGGEAIKAVKEDTGANIQVSKNNVRFPNTDERVISIAGELEAMKKVISFVQEKIRTDKIPPHVKNINTDQNDARKGTCKIVVPDSCIGKIIGKAGVNINRLKEEFGVKIGTMKKEQAVEGLRERIVTVEGEDGDKVDACIAEIVRDVYEDERGHMDYNVDYERFDSRGGDRGGDRGGGGKGERGGDRGHPPAAGGYDRYGAPPPSSGYGGYGHGAPPSSYGAPPTAPYPYPEKPSYGGERGGGGYGDRSSYSSGGYGGSYSSSRDYSSSSYSKSSDPYSSRSSDPYSSRSSDPYSSSASRPDSYSSRESYPSRDSYSRGSYPDPAYPARSY